MSQFENLKMKAVCPPFRNFEIFPQDAAHKLGHSKLYF